MTSDIVDFLSYYVYVRIVSEMIIIKKLKCSIIVVATDSSAVIILCEQMRVRYLIRNEKFAVTKA